VAFRGDVAGVVQRPDVSAAQPCNRALQGQVLSAAAALQGRLAHDRPTEYNAVQKLAYLFAIADIVLLVLSGLVVWKPVQFPLLRELMGDYDNARIVHFVAMAALLGFVAIHLAMVALVPKTLATMIRGR
jgi:thiosulfate reductase cytochrome b subunit